MLCGSVKDPLIKTDSGCKLLEIKTLVGESEQTFQSSYVDRGPMFHMLCGSTQSLLGIRKEKCNREEIRIQD